MISPVDQNLEPVCTKYTKYKPFCKIYSFRMAEKLDLSTVEVSTEFEQVVWSCMNFYNYSHNIWDFCSSKHNFDAPQVKLKQLDRGKLKSQGIFP